MDMKNPDEQRALIAAIAAQIPDLDPVPGSDGTSLRIKVRV